ncbi:MAG: DUF4292 domain-containing protein [Rhodothermales bacterium]|nr:DUF4292 domain-containing protein [Rhodothermales bacterium]
MRYFPKYWILIVLAAVSAYGCRSSNKLIVPGGIPETFPGHNGEQITRFISAGSDSLTGFTARANISVRSPRESLSFSSNISHRRSDSLYMSIKPVLGIEAGRALVTPDSFFVYDRIKKKLYYGDIDNAGEYLPGPVSRQHVFANLLGLPELIAGNFTVSSDSSHYFLMDSISRETYTVDPRIWRVIRYERFTDSGDVLEAMAYTDFDELDGFVLPRRVTYKHNEDGRSASIFYRSIDLNPERLNMNFEVSDSATQIPVR